MARAAAIVALRSATGRPFTVSSGSRIDERDPSGLESADVEADIVHVIDQLAYMVTMAALTVHVTHVRCTSVSTTSVSTTSVGPISPRVPIVFKFSFPLRRLITMSFAVALVAARGVAGRLLRWAPPARSSFVAFWENWDGWCGGGHYIQSGSSLGESVSNFLDLLRERLLDVAEILPDILIEILHVALNFLEHPQHALLVHLGRVDLQDLVVQGFQHEV